MNLETGPYARFINLAELEGFRDDFSDLIRIANGAGAFVGELKTYERHLVYIRARIDHLKAAAVAG